jgi:hypothetical protein
VWKSAAGRGTLACAALACRRCIRVVKIDIEKDTFIILVALAIVVYLFLDLFVL